MSKIERNREQKRRAIVEAARSVFLSEGYLRAGMDRIAARARVTKQTVYRYYPSKAELFEAALARMGEESEADFLTHLQEPDTREALRRFAAGFIHAHLSKEHLATFRLLVSESGHAPEMTSLFHAVGPDETQARLSEFFTRRLGVERAEPTVHLWTSMLLGHRASVLIGMAPPDDQRIEEYAREATDLLLAALSARAIEGER